MSLKMKCPSKLYDTKMACHEKWDVTQNGMRFKMECHSKWKVTQNRMSLKIKYHLKQNVTQN